MGAALFKHPIQVVGGADKGHVGKGLREIAQLFSGHRKLFGEETEMVRVAQHLLEDESCLIQRESHCENYSHRTPLLLIQVQHLEPI